MALVLAHRGASTAQPENTIAAFETAREMGADGVELDIRMTKDNVVVVHHDAELSDGRLIRATNAEQLPADVPTLAAVLETCAGLFVNVEIKNEPDDADYDPDHAIVPELLTLLRGRDVSTILVSSFDMTAINALHDLAPYIPTGFLTMDRVGADVSVGRAAAHGHKAVHPSNDIVTPKWVATAHEAELTVNVWTVDDPKRIIELAAMGVDAVITNVPDVARKALG